LNNKNKILVIFHLNFLRLDRGCSHGIYAPIKILKTLGYSIDLFCTNQMDDFSDFDNYNKENIIEKLFLVNIKESYPLTNDIPVETNNQNNGLFVSIKKILKIFHIDKIYRFLKKILKILHFHRPYHYIKRTFNNIKEKKKSIATLSNSRDYSLGSYVSDIVLEKFQEIIRNNKYNFIFMHYIEWADLFRYSDIPSDTKLIYNMHDSHFIQYSYLNNTPDVTGKVLDEDLKSLNYFNTYIYNSFDEMLFWSRFFPDKKHYFFPPVTQIKELPDLIKTIDVLCLGYVNPYNIEAAYWFLDNVCPLLPKNISITFCGKFTSALEAVYLVKIKEYNITTIDYADNLEELYAKTKIVIVPIKGGTGIKIKTLEALSYSIPVVSTILGVDGFPDKYENGCLVSDEPDEFANNIKNLLEDDVFYSKVKNKQNEYYRKYFSYESNINIIKNIFEFDNEK
jgi:glycosyltransferase involved in cell wall biosynthesis